MLVLSMFALKSAFIRSRVLPAIATQVLAHFSRSSNATKNLETFKANLAHYKEIHRAIWPGVKVPGIQTPKDLITEVQFQRNTISTSLLMSSVVGQLSMKFRPLADRAYTCSQLKGFLTSLLAHSGDVNLNFERLGDDALQIINLDPSCMVSFEMFWSDAFWRRHVSRSWAEAFKDARCTWAAVENPMVPPQRVHLIDVITFFLNAPDLQQWCGNFYTLVGTLALKVECSSNCVPQTAIGRTLSAGKKRTPDQMLSMYKLSLESIWFGEDT
jgi:hypothetical protein